MLKAQADLPLLVISLIMMVVVRYVVKLLQRIYGAANVMFAALFFNVLNLG